MDMITAAELSKILDFGYKYAHRKFREIHGTIWTFKSGHIAPLDLEIKIESGCIECIGTTYDGCFEDDWRCSLLVSYDEILEEYNKVTT